MGLFKLPQSIHLEFEFGFDAAVSPGQSPRGLLPDHRDASKTKVARGCREHTHSPLCTTPVTREPRMHAGFKISTNHEAGYQGNHVGSPILNGDAHAIPEKRDLKATRGAVPAGSNVVRDECRTGTRVPE
jgi:hypothetical protein